MKKLTLFTLLLILAAFAFADTFTIGDGTSATSTNPFYGSYNYGWSKTIYTQAEMAGAGMTAATGITGIGFYVGNTPVAYEMTNLSVYVRHTTATLYETTDNTYPDPTQFTLVWTGNATYNGGGWHYISFTTPFAWNGTENIEFLYEYRDGDNPTGYPTFRYTSTTPDYRTVYKGSDTEFPATLTGTRTYSRANIQIITPTTTPPTPAILVSPADAAILVSPLTTLNWMPGTIWPAGYRLFLGTDNPPTNLANNVDLGNVTSYNPTPDLSISTTYYWKIVPYNQFGEATGNLVWSFTTHGDASVTTLPYSQNFDSVTAPALPFDWFAIVQSTSTSAVAATYASTTYAHSQPNCVRLYNPSDAEATLIMAGPPIMAPLAVNSIRLKFWARSSGANYPLSIGVMANPLDATTYTEVHNLALTTTITEYVVNLTGYTGTGNHIAFKHGLGAASRSLYFDDVVYEQIAPNDLSCEQLSGNTTPSVGNATIYTASVRNWGTAAQSTYTVKLFNGNDVELATANGVAIDPDAVQEIPLSWTPTVEGPVALYAKVYLTGDINPANDQSPNLNISVMPAGMIVVTVGEGNLAEGVPLEFYYRNSLHQALYYPTEINMFGNITALTFYNNFVTNLPAMPCKFWLGTTALEDLSGGWILDGLTQVYDGTIDFPSGENTITIPLQVPFAYTGGNLVLYANRPYDANYYSSSDNFQAQTVGTNRARKLTSDSTTYDPLAPSAAGTLSGTFARTTFHMTPLSPNPLFSVSPASKNFGTVLMNSTHDQTFTIANAGGGTLTVNSISIAGSPHFSLQSLPTLPANLPTGQSITFVGRYSPTAAGTHSATITITDNRMTHTVALTGTSIDATIYTLPYAQNFDEVTPPALPLGWSAIVQSTSTTAVAATYASTTYAHSQPNCARLYNPSDADAVLILAGPPLMAPLTANTVRVRFWARSSGANYPISIGVMTNAQDAATYTEVHNIALTTTLTEYVLNLTGYTGTGTHIAFKHGLGSTSRNLYFDDVVFEQISPNDLACAALTGNTTPSVGQATIYTASVHNWGTAAQNAYTVKLFNADNVELAMAAGVTVEPDATVEIPLSWTPSVEGPAVLYGKVFLTGDVNPINDQSPNLNISVQPAGATMVTVGEGNLAEGVPFEFFYRNGLHQALYYQNELNIFGNVTALTFYNNFVTDLPNKPVKIWLGQTDLADLSGGWILPSQGLTLVYDGNVNFPAGQNTITIPLQVPFTYTSGNLVLYANRPMDTAYFSSSDNFQAQTIGTNRARKLYNDSTTYDPLAPSAAGTLSGTFAKTSFTFVTSGFASLQGTVTSGGSPLAGVNVTVSTPTPLTTVTAADGSYSFPFVIPGSYTASFSKLGYDNQSLPVVLTADQTTTLNVSMVQSTTISVTGTVFGSDQPTLGLVDVEVSLDGPLDYTGTTNASGQFTVTGVLTGQTYNYSLVKGGYQTLTGTIIVGTANYDMGNLVMQEVAMPPRQVTAAPNAAATQVNLIWRTPGAGGTGGPFDDFEASNGGWVPSSSWADPLGDWEWTDSYNPANYTDIDTYVDVPPTAAHSGTGMWGTVIQGGYTNAGGWSYLRKTFNLSGIASPVLDFWHYMDGYNTWDYGLIKANGTTVWGASSAAEFMPWQQLTVDLSAFANLSEVEISFEWYATSTVSYSGWYIDDVYVGPALNRKVNYVYTPEPQAPQKADALRGMSETEAADLAQTLDGPRSARRQVFQTPPAETRPFFGYRVWRLTQGSENNETSWVSLTANTITDTTLIDTAWATLPDGNYKWAVKGVYTNNVHSVAAFSNMLPILRNDMAALSIQGNTTPSVGAPSTYVIQVKNNGTDPQPAGAYTVKLMSGTTELASMPGVALQPGVTQNFEVVWSPAVEGPMAINGLVVLTLDSVPANNATSALNIYVQPAGIMAYTIGDGAQNARTPLDFYYKNSVHQYLIYPGELGNFIGTLTGLSLYNQFTDNLLNMPVNIWIGTTTAADCSAGWFDISTHTQVFSGTTNFLTGENTVPFPFNAPYLYLNGENLVLTFQRPMDTQYYSTTDYFKAQTIGTNRARKIQSDSTVYDPLNMSAAGTLTGQFPKTTFYGVPGGVGHLTGTVTGSGGTPLSGVSVFISAGYNATTDAAGAYTIHNLLPNTYTVNFSVYGYNNTSQSVTILEDQTYTLNVTMTPMATVNVTGTVIASDTSAGLSGASIHLEGYADYDANATATGAFTIPAVYANQAYEYTIMAPGYTTATGIINVGAANYGMGTITLNEIAYAPHSVTATVQTNGNSVDLTWGAPDPNAIEVTESFENPAFPPADWTQTITNTGPANSSGVYPTWCRFGSVTISGQPANPTDGNFQAGLWWAYENQDEWLITPAFNCPPGGYLNFDSYVFLGSTNADHYYVKISTDNGNSWTEIWDASAQTGGWNYYASPITIDLGTYGGQQIKLAFNAADGPGNDGLWYVWFMDNIYIGNALNPTGYPEETIRFSADSMETRSARSGGFSLATPAADTNPSRRMELGGLRSEPRLPFPNQVRNTASGDRMLTGYKVWRLTQGQENNESAWTSLTPAAITALNLNDPGWQALPNGSYRWAVRALYTGNVISVPSFSNVLQKVLETGMIAGVVRRPNTTPIPGATVTANGVTATTNNAGAYTLVLPTGTYSVTAAATGFGDQTINGVVVNVNQTTTLNFVMQVTANQDNVVPVAATALIGNYPNPFNPSTTISYSVKDAAPVRVEIFNGKGQLIRTLVNAIQPSGYYNAVWNGRDDAGKTVASGVYLVRMHAGDYRSTRKMMLME